MVMRFRVGQGFDVHALAPQRRLMLGGVDLSGTLHDANGVALGLLGHSDADVVAHAVIDALLGAAGMGDIGRLFPDGNEQYRDADSMRLLSLAWAGVAVQGWRIANIDVTVVAQAPKIAPHVDAMRATLAGVLGIEPSAISIKGKTTEWLGFTGRGEGIAALAVAALVSG
jgi:2-C-methyl-D-erythritol 2,4-cyclodiphosphate synthase